MLLNSVIEALGSMEYLSMSSNAGGNIAVLCKNQIFITCSDSSSKVLLKQIKMYNYVSSDPYIIPSNLYTDILFHSDGSMLVLYGGTHIAVIDLSNIINKIVTGNDDMNIPEVPIFIINQNNCSYISSNDRVSGNSKISPILKLTWHPLFVNEIIVLLDNNYILSVHAVGLFDTINIETTATGSFYNVYPLDTVEPIISYAYSNQSSLNISSCWNGLSLYLIGSSPVTSSRSGHVYALCPFIPTGTDIAIDNRMSSSMYASNIDPYINPNILREWISNYKNSHHHTNQQVVQEYTNSLMSYIDFISGKIVSTRVKYIPVLQGPFILDQSYTCPQVLHYHNKAGVEVQPSDLVVLNTPSPIADYDSNLNSTFYAEDGRDSKSNSDSDSGSEIPTMIMVSYTNGNNCVYMLSNPCLPLIGQLGKASSSYKESCESHSHSHAIEKLDPYSDSDSNSDSDSEDEIVLRINSISKIPSESMALVRSATGTGTTTANTSRSQLVNRKNRPSDDSIRRLLPPIEMVYLDSVNMFDQLVVAEFTDSNTIMPSAQLSGNSVFTVDPVLPHCIYLTQSQGMPSGATSGIIVYMICLSWWYDLFKLKTPTMLLQSQSNSGINADVSNGDVVDIEKLMKTKPMYCMPIFSQLIVNENTNTMTSRATIRCMCLLSSPLLGHKVLLKCDSSNNTNTTVVSKGNDEDKDTGLVMCVNVTIHMKLCELHSQLTCSKDKALGKYGKHSSSGQTQQMVAFSDVIESKLYDIRKVLVEIPTPSRKGLKTNESVATCSKLLSDSTLFIEEKIIIPLEELYQRLNYRMEIIRELYTKQVELLQGPNTSEGQNIDIDDMEMMQLLNKPNKNKEDMHRLNGLGIQKLMELVSRRQEAIQLRVDSINESFGIQKEMV